MVDSTGNARNVGLATARGAFWSGGGQAARQLIQVPASIVLARILVPEDFGVIGMAMVFVAAAQLLADFGIGAALVQSRDVSATVTSSCFWANLGVAGMLALGLVVLSGPVATFYDSATVRPVLIGLSLSLVVSAMITIPRALLHIAMDFAGEARAEVAGGVAGALVAITLAVMGFGVWSLVLQSLVTVAVTLVLSLVRCRWWPRPVFSWEAIRGLVHFSAGVLGSGLLGYTTRQADNLLIGRFLGGTSLGYYSLAYRLMLYPLTQVSTVVTRVLFPALSSMGGDLPRVRRAYLVAISSIATITFPMMLGLLAVAHDFILAVFGEKWLPAETVLRVFCLVGLMQSIGATVGTIYLATARTTLLFLMSAIFTPLFLSAFVVGLRWGIEGVAVAYALVSAGLLYVSVGVAFRVIELRLASFHRALAGPAASAVVMYLAVAGVDALSGDDLGGPATRLALLIPLGATVYLLASLVFNRSRLGDLIRRVRAVIGGAEF